MESLLNSQIIQLYHSQPSHLQILLLSFTSTDIHLDKRIVEISLQNYNFDLQIIQLYFLA